MKKFISLTLALLAILFCFVACKDKDTEGDPDATTTVTEETKSTVATELTEPAGDDEGWSKFY